MKHCGSHSTNPSPNPNGHHTCPLNPRTTFLPDQREGVSAPWKWWGLRLSYGGARKALPFIRPRLSMEGARLLKSNTNCLYDKTNTQPPSQSVLLAMSQAYK